MKRRLIIEINLTSSEGDPTQLSRKLDDMVSNIVSTAENELYDDSNKIVYNDWEDPKTCELSILWEVQDADS